MTSNKNNVEIKSETYWFNTLEESKTNWALIDEQPYGDAIVWFIDNNSRVINGTTFQTLKDAVYELMERGFDMYDHNEHARRGLIKPLPPFARVDNSLSC